MRRIKITYDVVTPESAADGEFAEAGWIDEEGIAIEPDAYDLEEYGSELAAVVALSVKVIQDRGAVEPSSYPNFAPGIWYTQTDSDTDYRTCAETRHSFHLRGFFQSEERAIYAAIRAAK